MASILTPQEAAAEYLARIDAESSLAAYQSYVSGEYPPAAHHRLLVGALESVDRGECNRLMICMPPGSAKSTWCSWLYPAWYLGRHPDRQVIAASHTAELAERFGRRVRNLVSGEMHQAVFESPLSADSAAAGRWSLASGGEYYAAGVGGSVTGRRADLVVIDDPVRSREDADSEPRRLRAWDWYTTDLLTRLRPGAAVIIVMTRWHEDDLGGRILARERDQWRVIELAMEALPGDPLGREPGERLWPEWYTDEMVATAKLDSRSWHALYQQQPASETGDYFQRSWMHDYVALPSGLTYYGASDYAATSGAGDYTEHGIFGADTLGNLFVVDWWRGQESPDVWIDAQCDLIQRYRPVCWFGESGPIRRSVEPFLLRRVSERNAWCRLEWLASQHDKEARARSIQALMSMGKVLWPRTAAWRAEVEGQMLRFPAGRHDDAVDVFSLIGRGLQSIKPRRAIAPTTNTRTPLDSAMGW